MKDIPVSFKLLAVLLIGLALLTLLYLKSTDDIYIFKGLKGPDDSTIVPEPFPAQWKKYSKGSKSRLAILLTDEDGSWLSLAHGLKSKGIPFIITDDYKIAARHKTILVYPVVSGKYLSKEALEMLAAVPENGGILIAANVLGGGMSDLFGFKEVRENKGHKKILIKTGTPFTTGLELPGDTVIRLGDEAGKIKPVVSNEYISPTHEPIATYEDGSAAITFKPYEKGAAIAFGFDFGDFIRRAYQNRLDGVAKTWINGYEPSVDIILRLLENIYKYGEPNAFTIGTVPFGKALSVMITHDVDYSESLKNAVEYARLEKELGVRGTYFIQTKYMHDYYDKTFFDEKATENLKLIQRLGMEIGSHSVSHSPVFDEFPVGTGKESYPKYRPKVTGKSTTRGGTILGELRVSRFLIEHFAKGVSIKSFRPGHLLNPEALPQLLEATGYKYSSSASANVALTNLPFQLDYNRDRSAETSIFEFPVALEDELPPALEKRLPEALKLADSISRYGGIYVVLIHTNVIGTKYEFERKLITALMGKGWFGSVTDFGDWWRARNDIEVDAERVADKTTVNLTVPEELKGLTLTVPAGCRLANVQPGTVTVTQDGNSVLIEKTENELSITFTGCIR